MLVISSLTFFAILNPWLYFPRCLKYKNFYVYSDDPLPESARSVLDEVENRIQESPLYNPNLKFKIFVRQNPNSYSWIPLQFTQGYGQTVSIIENVFISHADFDANKSYTAEGVTKEGSRDLTNVLAHEITHVLINCDSYKRWFWSMLKKCNYSSLGLPWKEEGYAEYIAKQWDEKLVQYVLGVNKKAVCGFSDYEKEYCESLVAVKHLLENRGMTITEILSSDIELQDVLLELRSSAEKRKSIAFVKKLDIV